MDEKVLKKMWDSHWELVMELRQLRKDHDALLEKHKELTLKVRQSFLICDENFGVINRGGGTFQDLNNELYWMYRPDADD